MIYIKKFSALRVKFHLINASVVAYYVFIFTTKVP